MTEVKDKKLRLRQLLEIANKDFSVENFTDQLLEETKILLVNIAGPTINYFTQGNPFGITQPKLLEEEKLKLKVQSNLGMVFLTFDKEGNLI